MQNAVRVVVDYELTSRGQQRQARARRVQVRLYIHPETHTGETPRRASPAARIIRGRRTASHRRRIELECILPRRIVRRDDVDNRRGRDPIWIVLETHYTPHPLAEGNGVLTPPR